MRRTGALVVALLLFVSVVAGQAGEPHAAEHGPSILWKWANFAILAGLLGYFVYKNAGAFFRGRTAQIQKGICEATELRRQAEAQYHSIEQRLANLGAEIEGLRAGARSEAAAEAERIRQATARDLEKIQEQARRDIEALTKAARVQLRAHAAQLAIELAREQVRARLTPDIDAALVESTAREFERRAQPVPARVS